MRPMADVQEVLDDLSGDTNAPAKMNAGDFTAPNQVIGSTHGHSRKVREFLDLEHRRQVLRVSVCMMYGFHQYLSGTRISDLKTGIEAPPSTSFEAGIRIVHVGLSAILSS